MTEIRSCGMVFVVTAFLRAAENRACFAVVQVAGGLYSDSVRGYHGGMNGIVFVRQFRRMPELAASGFLSALLAAAIWAVPVFCAARSTDKTALRRPLPVAGKMLQPDASGWTFGADAQSARWRRGISGAELQHKAVIKGKKAAASAVKANRKKANGDGGSVRSAGAGPEQSMSGVAVSWERDITTWQPETPTRIRQAGEVFSLHQRHIVRAQARAGDRNASVSVGPEFILKDERENALAKDPHIPDSTVGVGMQFMVGF